MSHKTLCVFVIAIFVAAAIPPSAGLGYQNMSAIWLLRGRLRLDVLAVSRAEQLARMAIACTPQRWATEPQMHLARILVALGHTDGALGILRSTPVPRDPFLNLELGAALWQNGDAVLAMQYWKKVPGLHVYFALRGLANESTGNSDAALADYRSSWLLDDTSHRAKGVALVHFCQMLKRDGEIPLALEVCQRAHESGNVVSADRLLGQIYFDKAEFAAAEKSFREAQVLAPGIQRADLWLGLAVARQGRVSEAIQIYERGVMLHPSDGWLQFELGRALLESGQTNDAQYHLEKSIELAPATGAWDSQYVDEARRQLDKLQ